MLLREMCIWMLSVWCDMNCMSALTSDPTHVAPTGSHMVDICLLSVTMIQKQLLSVTTNFPFDHLVLSLVPLLLPSTHVRDLS